MEPALANIFVGFYKGKLFGATSKPLVYFDMLMMLLPFSNKSLIVTFSSKNLMPCIHLLKFTFKRKQRNSLPFLNVFLETLLLDFLLVYIGNQPLPAAIYFGILLVQKQRNLNLINIPVHRALRISSKTRLDSELDKIRSILI